MFGILPTRVHGFLDYVIGLSLVIMPFILGHGAGPQTWLPVVLGGGMIVYSLLTEYEMGVVPLIGMPYHLILDGLGGMLWPARPGCSGSPTSSGFRTWSWASPRWGRPSSPRPRPRAGHVRPISGLPLEGRAVPSRPHFSSEMTAPAWRAGAKISAAARRRSCSVIASRARLSRTGSRPSCSRRAREKASP